MTSKQIFEYALIELNKVQAPSLLLEDYNYFINKAISQYINKVYNLYDIDQQRSDDLRVLKSTAILTPRLQTIYNSSAEGSTLLHKTFEVDLPDDYLHVLNCIVEYDVKATKDCYDKGTKVQFGAQRLTADMFSQIINNYYMRPMYKRPYYYINNVNTKDTYVTNDNQEPIPFPTDPNSTVSENVERIAPNRYGNKNKVRMEIRYGKDTDVFELYKVWIDYVKTPQFIRLTQDQVDRVIDTSQVLEFPDYVCQEIINELVKLLMENASDPRIQTNIPVNQTVSNPAQTQQDNRR